MQDIALLTEKRYLDCDPEDWYVRNIITEDSLVQAELESLGFSCKRVAWDNQFDPTKFRFALFRTTWNYFEQLELFIPFLDLSRHHVCFINDYEQIKWNLNKIYLLWLKNRGINIPPTKFIKKGTGLDLIALCHQNNWKEIIIKPCVSAAAWNTHYIKKINSESQNLFDSLIRENDMLIQVFQKNIVSSGEISIIMIGGKYSHAVLKNAKDGDFRVQDDFGGTVCFYHANKLEVDFAKKVIDTLPCNPIYSRVDLLLDNDGLLALSELELIEPEMWFRLHPPAAKNLANTIYEHIMAH